MKYICEICGEEFTGENAEARCRNHEAKHAREATPAIYDEPYVKEYEVLPRDPDDYSCCKLKDLRTGKILVDGEVYGRIAGTNIGSIEKLVGKKIRITSYTKIISNEEED